MPRFVDFNEAYYQHIADEANKKHKFRRLSRKYKPQSPEEVAQWEAFHALNKLRGVLPSDGSQRSHFLGPWLSDLLPVRISSLSFDADECVDLNIRFTEPMPADKFEPLFAEVFGDEGKTYQRFLRLHHFLPPSACDTKLPAERRTARQQAQAFATLLRMKKLVDRNADDDSPPFNKGRSLDECTDMSGSILPDQGPYPDRLKDQYWEVVSAFDWREPGFDWDGICPGSEGTTPPHVMLFLAHEVDFRDDNLVGVPEYHYITFVMRERLRDPAWTLHRFHPVVLFNFDGSQLRITQAHYDGDYLQLRRTDLIPLTFATDNLEMVKMALRWALARPLNTTLRDAEAAAKTEDVDPSFIRSPPTPPRRTSLHV